MASVKELPKKTFEAAGQFVSDQKFGFAVVGMSSGAGYAIAKDNLTGVALGGGASLLLLGINHMRNIRERNRMSRDLRQEFEERLSREKSASFQNGFNLGVEAGEKTARKKIDAQTEESKLPIFDRS